MSLSVIILTTLTYFYRDVDTMNREMDRHQKESFQKLFVENRLASILPKALSEKNKVKKDFYFFTNSAFGEFLKSGNPHLIFSFDNGNMLDKDFSNHVIGMLYLDTLNRLCIAVWPVPKRWPQIGLPPLKKEILLENVEQLKFSFYIPPEKDRKNWGINSTSLDIQGPWVSEWRNDYKQLPSMIKIELLKKNRFRRNADDVCFSIS